MSRPFGPLKEGDHELKLTCPGCDCRFAVGEYVGLVPIGPGATPEYRKKAREGRAYNAVCVLAHWACMTGEEKDPM
jgi:hypothetical protein